jgi:hypothetical protein
MNFRLVWMGPDDEPRRHSAKPAGAAMASGSPQWLYEQRGAQMVRREQLEDGRVKVSPLANFVARIVRDIQWDDDVEQHREFGLEAELEGQKFTFSVPAAEFSRMGWVLGELGPQAIVYPGQQQHARAAIQSLSVAIR